MGKGGKFGFKHSTRRGVLSKDQGSDESDEDYNVGADEEFDESDDCSFDGDDSEVSLGEFEDEEEEEDEDDEEDEEEEEEEEEEEMKVRKVAKPKGRRSFPGRKANAVMKPEKRKRVSYKEEDDDDDNYDDDDDEEFKPDEIDFVDDEDEFSVMEKNKKVRPFVREKGFAKGRKRKRNSKVLKKPMRKKPRKSGRLVKETSSGDDGEFTGKKLVVEERSKKISGRRSRRRFKPHSDSDFVSSGSSDFQYTISEEEREQVREGSKICTSLTTSLRSSSSAKRLQEEVPRQQLKRPGRKGKEKVEDLKNEAGKQVCGICLSEEGKNTVRGTLNCCDHYFCFACIMEWSKVESRCPLCKQRFVTIGKTARSNTSFDLRTMVINVPERDQVYQPSEEELRGYLDPYESVICTECHQGGDDSLMLLCDVCDSPAHTYCVGLGHEVPEGNWYCEGCRPTAYGSLNPQGLSPAPDRRATSNLSGVSSPVYNIGEGIDLNMTYVPDTPLTQETEVFSSSRRAVGDFHAGPPAFGSGANTVSERRRIRYRISNMLNHSDGRSNGVSARNLGTRLFGYQLDLGREVEPQQTITPESVASHHTFPEGRLQDNTTPFVHNRDGFSSGLSYSSGRGQNPTSASAFGMEFNPGLNYEQLPPFSTISVVGSDASASHYACREGTASSRASQGAVHTPF